MVYYLSDLHFGHTNIIKHCNRPFSSVEEMDETLIANWNARVGEEDTVWLIGDVVWDKRRVKDYLQRLRGHKILIWGNHDEGWVKKTENKAYFDEIYPLHIMSLEGHPVTLCHYPLLEWKSGRKRESEKIGYLIYGHIHNNVEPMYRLLFESENALNAGADVNNFVPVTFEELTENNRLFREKALEQLDRK